ncbi:hypothetical protein ACN9JG_21730 (plasmid) [Cereibacter azotoformans]|uniref:hypothetical protein n=1 Tax=Cereibacter azotoformans TaxID=43057 RepID=UPI003B228EE5
MFEAFLVTTSSAGLSALGMREQRSYELVSDTLREALGPDHAALLAEPVPTDQGDRYDWYAPVPGRAARLLDLDDAAQAAARARLAALSADVEALAERLGTSGRPEDLRLSEALSNAMRVPDEGFIHVLQREGAPPQPVLVNWAWTRDERGSVRGRLTGGAAAATVSPAPATAAGAGAGAGAAVSAAAATAAAGPDGTPAALFWLVRLGWLLLALMLALLIWLLLPACALRGLPGFCPLPPAEVSAAAARKAVLEDQIARIEQSIGIADNACQPLTPASAPAPAPAPVDPALQNRLDRAGAQRGRLSFSLAWDSRADLDLSVDCPSGPKIWFGGREACGGRLDVDSNMDARQAVRDPIENVFYGAPAPGRYRITVRLYARNGETARQPFRLMIRDGDEVRMEEGAVQGTGDAWSMTYSFAGTQ